MFIITLHSEKVTVYYNQAPYIDGYHQKFIKVSIFVIQSDELIQFFTVIYKYVLIRIYYKIDDMLTKYIRCLDIVNRRTFCIVIDWYVHYIVYNSFQFTFCTTIINVINVKYYKNNITNKQYLQMLNV